MGLFKIESVSEKHGYYFFLILVLGLQFFFPISTIVSDDVSMMYIASGMSSGNPEEHLIFSSIFIGFILKYLYSISSLISWYAILYLLFSVVNFTIFWNFISKNVILRVGRLILYLICIFIFFLSTQFHQFTIAAFYFAFSSFLLLFSYLTSRENKYLYFLGATSIISASIRFDCFYLSVFFIVPYVFISLKELRNKIPALLIIFSIPILMSISNFFYYYKDKDWRTFDTIKTLRSIQDNPHSREYLIRDELAKSAGWSENDSKLFLRFINDDSKHFGLESLSKIDIPSSVAMLWDWKILGESFRRFFNVALFSNQINVFFAISIFLTMLGYRYFNKGVLVYNICISAMLIMSLSTSLVIKERVVIWFLLIFIIHFIYSLIKNPQVVLNRIWFYILLAIVGIKSAHVLKMKLYNIEHWNAQNRSGAIFPQHVIIILPPDPNKNLFLFSSKPPPNFIYGGWLNFSPVTRKAKQRLGLDENLSLYQNFIKHKKVLIMCDPEAKELVLIHLLEEYGLPSSLFPERFVHPITKLLY